MVTFAVVATVIRLLIALSLALVLAFGIAIIAAGGYGELLAVYALYQQHDQASTRLIVLVATMLLVILIVIGPLVTYLINAFRPESDDKAVQSPGTTPAARRFGANARDAPPGPRPGGASSSFRCVQADQLASAVTGYVCPQRSLSVGEMWAFCAA